MWVHNATPEINAKSDYPTILGVSLPLCSLMLVIVCLRLYVRIGMLKRPGPDDWCIVAAAVRLTLLFVASKLISQPHSAAVLSTLP